MAGGKKSWEWDPDKRGRLIEGEDGAIKRIFSGGGGSRLAPMGRRDYAKPAYRSSRPMSASGRLPPYFSMSFVSKRRSAPEPGSAPAGRRWIVPVRGQRPAEAKYDRGARCWHVPAGLSAPEGHRSAGKGARAAGAAAAFQDYIDRARAGDDRDREVAQDDRGALSFGAVIGETAGERRKFWQELEARERSDGRVQGRLQAELPAGLEAGDYREIVSRFCNAFEGRGLPYWAAVHRPHVEEGSDPRNIHVHIIWSERPARRIAEGAWEFGATKDREARGPAWVVGLRDRYCEIAANVQERRAAARGEPAVGLYDARGYEELGIDKAPGQHLGRRRMTLERAGIPTEKGVRNAEREEAWGELVRLRDAAGQMDRVCGEAGGWLGEAKGYRDLARRYGAEGEALAARVDQVDAAREAALAARMRELDAAEALEERRSERERGIGRAVLRERWATGMLEGVGEGPLKQRLEAIAAEARAAGAALQGGVSPEVLASEEAKLEGLRREREAADAVRQAAERDLQREVEGVVLRGEVLRTVGIVEGLSERQRELEKRVSEAAWAEELARQRRLAEAARERAAAARSAVALALGGAGSRLDAATWMTMIEGQDSWLDRLRASPASLGVSASVELVERLAEATLRCREEEREEIRRVGAVATLERIDATPTARWQRVRVEAEEAELGSAIARRRDLEAWLASTPEGLAAARARGLTVEPERDDRRAAGDDRGR